MWKARKGGNSILNASLPGKIMKDARKMEINFNINASINKINMKLCFSLCVRNYTFKPVIMIAKLASTRDQSVLMWIITTNGEEWQNAN